MASLVAEQAPKILRRFKSDKKCQVALGSFDLPFKRKRDKNNPESHEPFRVVFTSMENKVGDEMIKWCEVTIDENFRIPDDIPGTIIERNADGTATKHQIGGMKVAEYITLTWEFHNGYLREDKEFHELSRLKYLEHESKADKEKIKKLEADLVKKEEKKVLGKVKGEIK